MEFLAELIAELILALGIFLFGWCVRHKNFTYAMLAVAMVAVDIIVLLKVLHKI